MDLLVKPCAVCDSICEPNLVRCRRCRQSFHKVCYPGVQDLCHRCSEICATYQNSSNTDEAQNNQSKTRNKGKREKTVTCFICEESTPQFFRKIQEDKYAHVLCILCSPAIKIDSFRTMKIMEIQQNRKIQKCNICNKSSIHLIQCQLCDYTCHRGCIDMEQDQDDERVERYFLGNDLSKFENSKTLLYKILTKQNKNFDFLFNDLDKESIKKLMICEHHSYQQFCWCFCGNPKLNNEDINPSVVCDGCEKYVHLSCSGLTTPDSEKKYFCPGCLENDIFRRNVQLPELLLQAINLQNLDGEISENNIKLLVAIPFNYSVKLQEIVKSNSEKIILYYVQTQISHQLSSRKFPDIFDDKKFMGLINYYVEEQEQKKFDSQHSEQFFLHNIEKILNKDLFPNLSRTFNRFHKELALHLSGSEKEISEKVESLKDSNKKRRKRRIYYAKEAEVNSERTCTSLSEEEQSMHRRIFEKINETKREDITDTEIVSVLEDLRKMCECTVEGQKILEKIRKDIQSLKPYEEYQGSFYQIFLVLPVGEQQRQQLIIHFCEIRKFLRTKELISKEKALQLCENPFMASALGYKNRKYLNIVCNFFQKYVKKIKKANKAAKKIHLQSLASIYQTYLIKQKGKQRLDYCPQSYETIKIEDILFLDEDAVLTDLVFALQSLIKELPLNLKSKVKKFTIKMRLLYQWIGIEYDVPVKSLRYINLTLNEIRMSEALQKVVDNHYKNKKKFKDTIWQTEQVLKSNICYNNQSIKKSVETICRFIQKYALEEQKTRDLSVIGVLTVMKNYFNWPTINAIERKGSEIRDYLEQLNKLKNIQQILESESKTMKVKQLLEGKIPDYKKNDIQCSREIKRMNILNQWCTISLKITTQPEQTYTVQFISIVYSIMIETSYPKNKLYMKIASLHKICKPLIIFCDQTLPKLRQPTKNPKTNLCSFDLPFKKISIHEFRYKVKQFREMNWAQHKIIADFEIEELYEEIRKWEAIQTDLLHFILFQNQLKEPKPKSLKYRYQNSPMESEAILREYEQVNDLKTRIQACPIQISNEIHYYHLVEVFNRLIGEYKAKDSKQKRAEAYEYFWSACRDRIIQVYYKKVGSGRKQWLNYIPLDKTIIRAISSRLMGSHLMQFQKYYEDNDTNLTEIRQLRKKTNRENTIEASRLIFLKEIFHISIFDNSQISEEIEELQQQLESFKDKLQSLIPYISEVPSVKIEYPEKTYFENSQCHKLMKKMVIRDLVVHLYERDIKICQYLRQQINAIAKQQSILKPHKSPNIEGYANFIALAQSVSETEINPEVKLKELYQNICNMSEYYLNAQRKKVSTMISKLFIKYLGDLSQNIDRFGVDSINRALQHSKYIFEKIHEGWFGMYIEEKEKQKMWKSFHETLVEVKIYLSSLEIDV